MHHSSSFHSSPRVLILGVAVLLSGLVGSASSAQPPDREQEVLRALDSWNEGWKTRDAALAVADYAEDADWTNAFGDRFQSRAELKAGLEFIFSLDFVMAGDSEGNTYQDVTFLSEDVALIRSQLTRKGQQTDDGQTMKDRHINHLRVLQRRQGRWWIVSHLISQAKEKGSV